MAWHKTQAGRERDARVYQDPEYRRNKALVRKRSGGRCEIQTEGICIGRAGSCDHIIAVSQGGTHDLANLRDACQPCHQHKTAREGSSASRSADPDPLARTAW